jgi:hypothetical protein
VKDIRRQDRQHFSAEDKTRIELGNLRGADCPETTMAAYRLLLPIWARIT